MTVRPPFRWSGYLPALDGVRSFAVLAVVFFHARQQWFPGGYIGVDIFFVLSGFLITTILLEEREATGRVSVKSFYARRALRLLPALLLVCAVVTVAFLLVPGVTRRSETLLGVLTAVTYTSSPVLAGGASNLGWMIPTWSLSVEEYFYLIWPFILIAATSPRIRRWRALILALTATAIVYRFLAATVFGWSLTRVAYGADTRAEQLLIGCLLAVMLRVVRGKVPTWVVVLTASLLTLMIVLPTDTEAFYLHGGSTVVAVAAAVMIGGLAQQPSGLPSRLLSIKPLVWIGQRSYGIYLWNLPIIALIASTSFSDNQQLAIKIGLTFLIPALSYLWIERPLLRLKRRSRRAAKVTTDSTGEGRRDTNLAPAGQHRERPASSV